MSKTTLNTLKTNYCNKFQLSEEALKNFLINYKPNSCMHYKTYKCYTCGYYRIKDLMDFNNE